MFVFLYIDEIIRLYNLRKIKNTIMISSAIRGKSRVLRMKNNKKIYDAIYLTYMLVW